MSIVSVRMPAGVAAVAAATAVLLAIAPASLAFSTSGSNFEVVDFADAGYTVGDQSPTGENGWHSVWTAGHWFDWALVGNSSFPDSGLDAAGRSLRFSNAIDNVAQYGNINQLSSPALTQVAGESATGASNNVFDATFTVASASGGLQERLATSVTVDNGSGSRSGNGVTLLHTAAGLQLSASWVDPAATGADLADWRTFLTPVYDASVPHKIRLVSEYVPGDTSIGPDTLKVYLDDELVIDGYSYEGYHEAANSGQASRVSSSLLFRASSALPQAPGLVSGLLATSAPTTPQLAELDGKGFLFSGISYATYKSTPTAPPTVSTEPQSPTAGTAAAAQVGEPNEPLTFEATGFGPYENVGVTIFSSPYFAGWFRANSAGVVTGSIVLPASVGVGTHTLQAVGQTTGNVATAAFTVGLPATGGEVPVAGLLTVGGLLIAGGLAAVLIRRRLPQRRH